MVEFFLSLLSSLLRVKRRPYLTFFLRVIVISSLMIVIVILLGSNGLKISDILDRLPILISVSLAIGFVTSLIASLVESGREDVEDDDTQEGNENKS